MRVRDQFTADVLLEIGQHAIARSIWTIRHEVTAGRASNKVEGYEYKPEEDPTKYVDKVAENIILKYLEEELKNKRKIQYYVSTEEEGTIRHMKYSIESIDDPIDLVVFIDPVDFTESAVRGLDGSSLLTFYSLQEQKILAAIVGDIREQKLYFASEDKRCAHAQFVKYDIQPEENSAISISGDDYSISGNFKDLNPSNVEEINKAHINCLVNKQERIREFIKRERLIDAMGESGRLYIMGGSLGITRAASGILDAAVEFAKGFKEWDAWPGLYICKKAGCYVRNLDGTEISFKLNIPGTSIKKRLEKPIRQKFIVAGNKILGEKLRRLALEQENQSGTHPPG